MPTAPFAEDVHVVLPVAGHHGKVTINGKEWKSVRDITIRAGVGEVTTVQVEFYANVNLEQPHD